MDNSTVPRNLTLRPSLRFVIHDRDSIFSAEVDQVLKDCKVRVLKAPLRAPMANAFYERLIGTIRRECLDHLIPINERHLRGIVKEFATHYNRGRPHSALGLEVPEPNQPKALAGLHRPKLPVGYEISTNPDSCWLASRIWPKKGGCLAADGVFAYHRSRLSYV